MCLQLFSQFGQVLKIVTFTKNGTSFFRELPITSTAFHAVLKSVKISTATASLM